MSLHSLRFLPLLFLPSTGFAANDHAVLAALFGKAEPSGAVITIPPGDYNLDGAEPLPLASNTTVLAHGARFHFP